MNLYYVLLGSFMILYGYYNFLLVILIMEFFLLLMYFYSFVNTFISLMGYIFLMIMMCFMVLEAILGFNLILLNYRYFGMSFFNMW